MLVYGLPRSQGTGAQSAKPNTQNSSFMKTSVKKAWWPRFKVEVEVVRNGLKIVQQTIIQAPSRFRAEEFACYQFEADPTVNDFEVIGVVYCTE